jgi:hypothetical protein
MLRVIRPSPELLIHLAAHGKEIHGRCTEGLDLALNPKVAGAWYDPDTPSLCISLVDDDPSVRNDRSNPVYQRLACHPGEATATTPNADSEPGASRVLPPGVGSRVAAGPEVPVALGSSESGPGVSVTT